MYCRWLMKQLTKENQIANIFLGFSFRILISENAQSRKKRHKVENKPRGSAAVRCMHNAYKMERRMKIHPLASREKSDSFVASFSLGILPCGMDCSTFPMSVQSYGLHGRLTRFCSKNENETWPNQNELTRPCYTIPELTINNIIAAT